MSYFDAADTDDEEEKCTTIFTEGDIADAQSRCAILKASNFEEAVKSYTDALNALKSVGLTKDCIIMLNRSASYIALKRYVPALNDANQAAGIDPSNWKAHWRKGVALMAMSKRLFRTKQSVEAFEMCLQCKSLPENKIDEVKNELKKSKYRLQQQQDEILVIAYPPNEEVRGLLVNRE